MTATRLKGQAWSPAYDVYDDFARVLLERVGHQDRELASRYYLEISFNASLEGDMDQAEALARTGHEIAMRAPDSSWVLQSRAKTTYGNLSTLA